MSLGGAEVLKYDRFCQPIYKPPRLDYTNAIIVKEFNTIAPIPLPYKIYELECSIENNVVVPFTKHQAQRCK